jgi:hypothetical protein
VEKAVISAIVDIPRQVRKSNFFLPSQESASVARVNPPIRDLIIIFVLLSFIMQQ